jgi:hypothetical protein
MTDREIKTGLIIGKGRWAKELLLGDVINFNGLIWTITYTKEWGAFTAESSEGDVLFLAQNSQWYSSNDYKLDVSKAKLLNLKKDK